MIRKWTAFLVPVLLAATGLTQGIIPFEDWTIDLQKPASHSMTITRGESRYIRPTVTYQGPWVFPTNAGVVMHYKSSDMTNTYYTITGEVYDAASGVLRILWTPTNEAYAKAYSFEIEAATGTTAQIAIAGSLYLRDSLTTWSGSTPPTSKAAIDWGITTNINVGSAPFALKGIVFTDTVAYASIALETTNRIAGDLAGSNQVFALAASISNGFLRVINQGGGKWGFLLPGE